jgi:multiple sugar transport system ATP-binding protein
MAVMVTLSLRKLTKRFGAVAAVDQANLDVNAGEFLVIVGESGCGKTTTLRLIAGLEQPDSGTIFINGAPVNDIPVGRRNVQMIFQNYALWPHMRVFDADRYSNLTLPLKVNPISIASRPSFPAGSSSASRSAAPWSPRLRSC